MEERLAAELIDAVNSRGAAVKKEIHIRWRMRTKHSAIIVEKNRAKEQWHGNIL